MVKITYNGRAFDARRFAQDLEAKVIKAGMDALEKKARGAAASIVDPETGHHADVFVDRLPGNRLKLRTSGSEAFARLLETRLGVGKGEVEVMKSDAATQPKVYLAHASDDKAVVRPIAEYLMSQGIDVWFDEWEIEPGDSLRQKMEEGLEDMTHFLVVLTKASIAKPWVNKEIDVGLVEQVGGKSRFVPVVVGIDPAKLSPFLRAMLFLQIDPGREADLKMLVDRLHGVSRKPALGDVPRYVRKDVVALGGWSPAALAVGRHLVETSVHGLSHDPIRTIEELAEATGLEMNDVKVAVLDLSDAGRLWQGNIPNHIAADASLFVEFDEAFMPFSPKEDAQSVANMLITGDDRVVDTEALSKQLGWEPRRMNSAIAYLTEVDAINARTALSSPPWRAVQLIRTDRTLRFAQRHA